MMRNATPGALCAIATRLLSIALIVGPAWAGEQSVAEQALEAARSHLEQAVTGVPGEVRVRVAPLDPRLRLQPCTRPPEAFLPAASRLLGNLTVGLRCPDPSWTVYTTARIDAAASVLIAAKPLARGHHPAVSDVRPEHRELAGLHAGYLTSSEELHGKRLRRGVRAGAVVVPSMLESIPLVQRGETVTLRFDSELFRVLAEGTALEDAGRGEHLRIRSHSSNRIVHGQVGEDRVVTVLR
jgi:flagella basal body P-ring formation protein FlgA